MSKSFMCLWRGADNMVEYTSDDHGLTQIVPALPFELATLPTRHQYHVFGLRNDGRPHVSIVGGVRIHMEEVSRLLQQSGLACHIDGQPDISVNIGLRRDLRERPEYATKLLATIIQMLEGRLEPFAVGVRLPAMPAAVRVVEVPAVGGDAVNDAHVLAKLEGDRISYATPTGPSEIPYYFAGRNPPADADATPGFHWIKIVPRVGGQNYSARRWLVAFQMNGGATVSIYRGAIEGSGVQTIEDAYTFDGAVGTVLRRYHNGPSVSIGVITWMEE